MGNVETMEEVLADLALVSLALRKKVVQLPDNPKINRINDRCFTISSADLGPELILDPVYHDFKAQYLLMAGFIEKTIKSDPYKAVEKIIETLKTQRLYISPGYTQKLNADVCTPILKIMKGA